MLFLVNRYKQDDVSTHPFAVFKDIILAAKFCDRMNAEQEEFQYYLSTEGLEDHTNED